MTAYDGHTDCAIPLLEFGAPLLARNKFGDTIFHLAIRHGHLDYIRRILEFVEAKKDILMNDPALQKHDAFDIEND
jgi:ankyrin repeat protein